MFSGRIKGLGLLVLVTVACFGCENNGDDTQGLLMEENTNLRSQLADRNRALDEANRELRERAQMIAELRQGSDVPPFGETGFEGIPGVQSSFSAGEVTATIESDILFDSGSAELKPAARRALDEVAQVISTSYAGHMVRVGGHTDTDPIRRSGFDSNYHLGFERAWAVRQYLMQRSIGSDQVYIASYGPDRPVGGEKERNRRVEITVIVD